MITTRQILKAIGCPILNLYQGKGYWYFVYDDLDANVFETHSVYAVRLNQLPLETWVQEGQDFVKTFAISLNT